MSGAQSAETVWYLLALILVGSALFARRWSLTSAIGMAGAWIAIFLVVLIAFSYRHEVKQVGSRVRNEVIGAPIQQVSGQSLRVNVSDDGHYWVDGTLNGTSARFLIDSGASVTALSDQTASRAGLNVDPTGMPAIMQTANGPVKAARSSVSTLAVGPVRASDLDVVVSPAFGDVNVLGMNFLSKLKSWRVEDGVMVLQPY